jgi:hypothetical protein
MSRDHRKPVERCRPSGRSVSQHFICSFDLVTLGPLPSKIPVRDSIVYLRRTARRGLPCPWCCPRARPKICSIIETVVGHRVELAHRRRLTAAACQDRDPAASNRVAHQPARCALPRLQGRFPPLAMEFDHRDPRSKRGAVMHTPGRASDRLILEEAAKCDIVCTNCHRHRTFVRRNAGDAGVAQLGLERLPSKQ